MSERRVTIEIGIVEMDGYDRPVIYVPASYLNAMEVTQQAGTLSRWITAINRDTATYLGVRISE